MNWIAIKGEEAPLICERRIGAAMGGMFVFGDSVTRFNAASASVFYHRR